MHKSQTGITAWIILLLLSGMAGVAFQASFKHQPRQAMMQKTMASLALAQQALLAYANQPLGLTQCDMNCQRPGDLPCPDRNNDGLAETSCSNTARVGRLPWKTLGLGDIRDGSGERLWYAVSERYKNNPRILPLNTDTPGSWTVSSLNGIIRDATQGNGVVAVIIAPMQPVVRKDGWAQQRNDTSSEVVKHYLDIADQGDNASAIENSASGFVQAVTSTSFNDVVWPVTATMMHHHMQQQVVSELKRASRCALNACVSFPMAAAITDSTCLGSQSLSGGQCLSAASGLGRLPLDAAGHWPLAAQHMLDGDARHHWFQQNGWREQVFYQPGSLKVMLVVAGEKIPPQMRSTATDKSSLASYLEASTLQKLQLPDVNALAVSSNDSIER
ncbi:MAG TPA: hypothetical protein VK953_01660 [Methylophilus sp.]|nr:hypothetical protein [Methylophilus sp.]